MRAGFRVVFFEHEICPSNIIRKYIQPPTVLMARSYYSDWYPPICMESKKFKYSLKAMIIHKNGNHFDCVTATRKTNSINDVFYRYDAMTDAKLIKIGSMLKIKKSLSPSFQVNSVFYDVTPKTGKFKNASTNPNPSYVKFSEIVSKRTNAKYKRKEKKGSHVLLRIDPNDDSAYHLPVGMGKIVDAKLGIAAGNPSCIHVIVHFIIQLFFQHKNRLWL